MAVGSIPKIMRGGLWVRNFKSQGHLHLVRVREDQQSLFTNFLETVSQFTFVNVYYTPPCFVSITLLFIMENEFLLWGSPPQSFAQKKKIMRGCKSKGKKAPAYTSCSTPTTAASAHCGCDTKADSTSAVPIRCPLHMHMKGKIVIT